MLRNLDWFRKDLKELDFFNQKKVPIGSKSGLDFYIKTLIILLNFSCYRPQVCFPSKQVLFPALPN
jgi:hypothetical protein